MKYFSNSLFSPTTDKGHRVRRWVASIIAGLLLLTLAFTSGVLAAPHDNPTVFYACVNNNSGTIHMTTADATCHGNEQKISWNQVGPAGPQGPQGPAGPQGPRGPSDGFSSVNDQQVTINANMHLVALTNLPPGKYIVNASVTVLDSDAGGVDCTLTGTQPPIVAISGPYAATAIANHDNVSMTGSDDSGTNPANFFVDCQIATSGTILTNLMSSITAIRVEMLTTQ